jgi:hypothetical protein
VLRLGFWFVQSAVMLAIAAPEALANHIAGATYNGTHAQGGTVSFTVTPDGTGISSFSAGGPVQGDYCSFPSGSSTTYGQPLAITNHAFTDTTGPFTKSGTFPGVQSASGTFRIKTPSFPGPACDSGDVSWTATTTAPPPSNPPPVGPPPPGTPLTDVTAPQLILGGGGSQRLGKAIRIRASCRDEPCRVRARGTLSVPDASRVFRLRSASAQLSRGQIATLKLRLSRRALTAARKALKAGRRVRARIAVVAVDAAGNRRVKRLSIRLRR